MIEEQWAAIEGFPDYAVSNYGRIMNVKFNTILKSRPNSYGNHRVALYKDGKPHDLYVHRLVAKAFIDGYSPDLRVFHHDHDKTNSHVWNLRFKEGQRMGQLIKAPEPPVHRRVHLVELNLIFRTVADCADYIGGYASSIYRVIRGERPSHLGYTFKWIESNE